MKTSYLSSNDANCPNRLPACAALFALLFAILPFLLSVAASGAPMSSGDPSLLDGPAPGPCAGANVYPDYIGGTDAYGHPVAPAEVPSVVSVKLPSDRVYAEVRTGHGGRADVAVDVKGLRDLMNAPDGCAVHRRHR